jgi:hypothetical protein
VGPGRPGSDSPTFLRGLSVPALIAHEYAHAVQQMAGLVLKETPTIVTEQQADCLSGVYLRWVAECHSPRFTVSTGDGLDRVLAGLITIRDPETPEDTELSEQGHGTAADRVSAFGMGFVHDASACAAIDVDEIRANRIVTFTSCTRKSRTGSSTFLSAPGSCLSCSPVLACACSRSWPSAESRI